GRDVGEEYVRRLAEFLRELGIKVSEDVELGDQRFALIEMLRILSCPEEALAGRALKAERVYFAAAEDGFVFFGEVVTGNADEIHVREEAGGYCEISCRAADNAVHLAVRAFNGVECYGTYDEK